MATLNQIRATRVHSETDRRVIEEARDLQRRMDRAAPYAVGPRLRQLSVWLHKHRAEGFPADLHWFLGDFRTAILLELDWAEGRMTQAAEPAQELAA
jgi:hypothetical protein